MFVRKKTYTPVNEHRKLLQKAPCMKMYFLHFQPAMLVLPEFTTFVVPKKNQPQKNTLEGTNIMSNIINSSSKPQLQDCEQLVPTEKKTCDISKINLRPRPGSNSYKCFPLRNGGAFFSSPKGLRTSLFSELTILGVLVTFVAEKFLFTPP